MAFSFGAKSQAELEGVDPRLVEVATIAIGRSPVDFSCHDGCRTEAEQREYVRTGASQTMDSKHRKQADGLGHAVDLVPYINGKLRWEWEPIYQIAAVMREVAIEKGLKLRWGGVWDKTLNDLPAGAAAMKAAVAAYCVRHPGKDFIDGPHYELK
jgi:peptidoglycan L-alanyl-D-glutamate endopeptidase CwlK